MNRDELLTKMAMELDWWPYGAMNTHTEGVEIICKDEWLQRRAELINKPPWDDAPEWARWLAQDGINGKWWWYECWVSNDDEECFDQGSEDGYMDVASYGTIPAGHDWRNTLEKRPGCGSLEGVTTSLGATGWDARKVDKMKVDGGSDFTTSLGATDYAEDSDQDSVLSQAMRSDGSTAKYYELPIGAIELQDLISYRNMNAQIGEVFRAAYRYGQASHSDKLRDAKKIRFYAEAEIARLERYGDDR